MRAFIVLSLVAVACADHLGYNYQPVGHSDGGLSFAPGAAYGSTNNAPSYAVHENSDSPSYGGQASNISPSFGSGGSPSFGSSGSPSFGSSGSPSFGSSGSPSFGSSGSPSFDAQGSNTDNSFAPQGELEKQFFTYTANDEEFNDPAASNQIASNLKQGLRVVFIKGPDHSGLEDAALALAKQAANQHTDIYVLNKQTDLSELANKLNTENSNSNNKPEVHFVKYRTPEDADNAQKAIQGQYDALGGKSEHIDGGVAPSLNFASQAPAGGHHDGGHHDGGHHDGGHHDGGHYDGGHHDGGHHDGGHYDGGHPGSFGSASGPAGVSTGGPQGSFGSSSAPSSTYLPPSVFRRRFRL